MADRMTTDVDFNDVGTTNLRVPTAAGDVDSPKVGEVWLDTTAECLKVQAETSRTMIMCSKYTALLGDGSATSYAITHNLNTTSPIVDCYVVSSGLKAAMATVTVTSANVVTVTFSVAPASNANRIVIIG